MSDGVSILEPGARGQGVKDIQKRLHALGVYTGPITGYYGDLTKAAVETAQTRYIGRDGGYLAVDGIVGPETWWALNHPTERQYLPTESVLSDKILPNLPARRRRTLEIFVQLHSQNIREIPIGSNWGDGIPWFGGWRGAPWCAFCLTKVWQQAGVDLQGLHQRGSTWDVFQWALGRGYFYPVDTLSSEAFFPGNAILWQYKGSRGNYLRLGHIACIAIPSIWEEDVLARGKLRSVNTFAGNEGHRLRFGVRDVWSQDDTLISGSIEGFINPFPLEDDDYELPEVLYEYVVRRESGDSSTR